MPRVVVTGSFDDLRSRQVRFLQEAARLGELHVLLWSDALTTALDGKPPRFPQAERLYILQAIRYVSRVTLTEDRATSGKAHDLFPQIKSLIPDVWAVRAAQATPAQRAFCATQGIMHRVLQDTELAGFTEVDMLAGQAAASVRPKVLVTGCFDWLHSGHVRFFEETSALGDLIVVVGNDRNVRLLKGQGHPLFPQEERRYMVQAIRYVSQALVSSGEGWMDAEPEVQRVKPQIYAVNEDGDRPEKRAFCAQHGLEYVVLKRAPKTGLPRRESTVLRGF